jgi:hypothetical protein
MSDSAQRKRIEKRHKEAAGKQEPSGKADEKYPTCVQEKRQSDREEEEEEKEEKEKEVVVVVVAVEKAQKGRQKQTLAEHREE